MLAAPRKKKKTEKENDVAFLTNKLSTVGRCRLASLVRQARISLIRQRTRRFRLQTAEIDSQK